MTLENLRLADVINFLPDATFVIDREGRVVAWNKAIEVMTGISAAEMLGKADQEYALPFYGKRIPILIDMALSPRDAFDDRYPFVKRENDALVTEIFVPALKPDGAYLWVKASPLYNDRGEIIGAIETIRDITKHKITEKALRDSQAKLRFLSSQLLKAHEQERRRLSAELHDELGQTLNVFKLQVRFIEKRLGKEQKDLRTDCEYLLHYTDEIIESVRRISRDLSPSILEDLGLACALEHLTDEFTKHYKTACAAKIDNIDQLFPQDFQILIFRIFQESLTNIAKHAEASQVELKIEKKGEAVFFSMADNGKGFNLKNIAELNPTQKGLGLAVMEERVHMLGGTLDICSLEGLGTRISFSLKLS
jgi:PAS domain S-box-containing protein